MKVRILPLLSLILLGFTTTVALAFDQEKKQLTEYNQKQNVQYQILKKTTPGFFGSFSKSFSMPDFLYGEPLFKSEKSGDSYEQTVNNFLKTYPDLFQTTISDFKIQIEKPKDRNITQVHLFQKYNDVPVFGAELIFTFNDKQELVSYLGKYIPNLDLNVKPTITRKEVQYIIAKDLKVNSVVQEPKLFIFNKGVLTNNKEITQLVWRLGTNGWVYFINANTKEIVYKYQDENDLLNREVYTAEGGTPTLPGTSVISEGDDTSATTDDDAINAYAYSNNVYDYYYDNFSLDSFNDSGASLISTVDYDLKTLLGYSVGAAWCNSRKPGNEALCPTTDEVIFEDQYAVLDVVAHEWTHAIDDYAVRDETTGLFGLTDSDEPGALKESYSDIFGVLIEAEYGDGLDWDIGEDLSTGAVRSLADPTLHSQPDDWSGYVSGGSNHYNDGIPNKAAYLIMREKSEGYETFNGIDVRGVGTDKAQKIFYYTLRDELITAASFTDNLDALTSTCLTLDDPDITTVDCESVVDAYTAIGVADGSFIYVAADIITDVTSGIGPLTVNFDGTDSVSFGRNITSYAWSFGDGDSGMGSTTSHTYDPGTYTVTLTITDSDGQTDTETIDITVTNPIEPTFNISGDGVAAPASVSFDASGTIDHTGTIASYYWNFGDGTGLYGGITTSHTYSSNGYYHAALFVTDGAGYTGTFDQMVYIGTTSPTTVNGTVYTDTWTAAHSPYVISSSVTISSGSTLTIEPGVVVKFASSSGTFNVSGTLDATGTSTAPIIFTSYKDDTFGGDTNGDGSATTPAAGDWGYIKISGSATANLDYVTVQYGGASYDTMFLIDDNASNVTIDHSTLQNSNYYTLKIDPGSTSTIQRSTITGTSGSYGIYVTGGTTTFDNNTISAPANYALVAYNASPTITNNTFTNSNTGLYIAGTTSVPTITNNNFTNNEYAVRIDDAGAGMTITGNTGSHNTNNVIALTGTLSGDFTLNIDNDLPYVLWGGVTVPSSKTMTITPGTTVKFLDASSLTVYGTLNATGTSTTPIIFTSYKDDTNGGDTNNDGSATSPAAGDWSYIKVSDHGTVNFDYVTVQYGGASYDTMFLIDDNASNVTIDHSTLQNSNYYTLKIDPGSTSTITNSTLTGTNRAYGIYVNGGTTTFDNNIISAPSNYALVVYNASPTITNNTFTNSGTGLYITGTTSVPTITDNNFTNNEYAVWLNDAGAGMTITGNTGSDNTYNVIALIGTLSGDFTLNKDNDLPYVIWSNVTVPSGKTMTITPGTTMKFLDASSLYVSGTLNATGTSTTPIIFTSYKDDTFGGDTNGDGSATTPAAGDWGYIKISGSATANLDYVTVQYGGASYDTMFLIDDNATNVTIDHSTLQNSNYYTLKIDPGSISTVSNSTITGFSGSYGIYITGGTTTFDNNIISAPTNYALVAYNASPTITNNTFTNSGTGLYIGGTTSVPTITNNNFTNNEYAVRIDNPGAGMTITGNTGSLNTYNVIALTGTLSGDMTLNMDNDLFYALWSGVTVESGKTMTILPSTTVKFLDTNSLTVNGTLNAQGTTTEPITFTSIKDDTNGGDTNGDGSSTSPAAGDWISIKISGGAIANFDYVTMQYGGYSAAMLLIDDNAANVTVDHSTLQNSKYHTLDIDPNSTSVISNSTISNTIDEPAINITGGTTVLDHNTIFASADVAVNIVNAAPTITNNDLSNSHMGSYVNGSSSTPIITDNIITNNVYGILVDNANPTVSNNQISGNTYIGLYSTTTITAENNWWGDSSGPYNATTNPTGLGDSVSDHVDFDPWTTVDPDADVTPPGDITLGPIIKKVWPKVLVLNWTNPTDSDLDHIQVDRTDVTTGTTITLSTSTTGTEYADTTPGYNSPYTYTLYTVDTTGNKSAGIITSIQVLQNPAPDLMLLTPGDTTITVAWKASSAPAPSLAGYKIYYGTSATSLTNILDVGLTRPATITGLTNGIPYYVVVTAYNKAGMESAPSKVRVTVPHP